MNSWSNALATYPELGLWPDLGDIERIKPELLGVRLLGLHDLNIGSPCNRLALLDGTPQVTLGKVGVFTSQLDCFVGSKLLLPVVCNEMVFHVYKLAVLVDPVALRQVQISYNNGRCLPSERVAAKSILEPPALRCAMVAEEHESSVVPIPSANVKRILSDNLRFSVVCEKIKQGIPVKKEVLRIAILRANYIRSLERVTAEENGLYILAKGLSGRLHSQSSAQLYHSCLRLYTS